MNPTKQNHLRGCGTTALQARVLAETESLRTITGGQQERNPLLTPGSKKWSYSNPPDQGNSCKWLKAAQLEANPEPENFQADTDPMDPLPVVVAQLSKVVERTRHVMEQCWGARRGNGYDDGGGGGRDNVQDEDDEANVDKADVDEDDEDNEADVDVNKEDKDEAKDENRDGLPFSTSVPGLSTWDLLGEDFEREAAHLSCESPTN